MVSVAPAEQEVLTLDPPDASWLAQAPCRCHALGPASGKYRFTGKLIPYLRQIAGNYQAVLVHGLWQYHAFATHQALRGTGLPYFLFPHGMLDPWFRRVYPLKHAKKMLYWHWREKKVLQDAAMVLFTSQEELSGAHQSFSFAVRKEGVISLGIGDPAVPGRERDDREETTLLFLGRLDRKKGCDLLLQAFAEVMRGTSWRLVMAGPDTSGWKSTLQALAEQWGIAGQIDWPGTLLGEAKWAAIRQASALVLPSHQENFGLVVIEALACGTPVLLSHQVNIWREITDGGAGLAASDDLPGTRQLLQSWSDLSLSARQSMRVDARSCFVDNFDITRVYQQVREVTTAHSSVDGQR